jgi:hypothetical protein
MDINTYKLFGVRIPDLGETGLSWAEVLVWLRIKGEQ